MTTDISGVLASVADLEWELADAVEVASTIAGAASGVIDHDPGAGEAWVRILVGDAMVGLVHARRPFLIVEPAVVIPARQSAVLVILSASMNERNLRARGEAMDEALGRGSGSPAVAEAFSPADLWFATV